MKNFQAAAVCCVLAMLSGHFFKVADAQISLTNLLPSGSTIGSNTIAALANGVGILPDVAFSLGTLGQTSAVTGFVVLQAFQQKSTAIEKIINDILTTKAEIEAAVRADARDATLGYIFNPLKTIETRASAAKKVAQFGLSGIKNVIAATTRWLTDPISGIPALLTKASNLKSIITAAPAQVTAALANSGSQLLQKLGVAAAATVPLLKSNALLKNTVASLAKFITRTKTLLTGVSSLVKGFTGIGKGPIVTLLKGWLSPLSVVPGLGLFRDAIDTPTAAAAVSTAGARRL